MNIVKRLLLILFILVLLLVAGIVAAVMLVDREELKQQVIDQVGQQTGRQLSIPGDVGISFFPQIGLSLGQASLSNAKGFGAQPMASVEKVELAISVLPLILTQSIEVDVVRLHGMNLNLMKNKVGKPNWEFESAAPKPDAKPKQETEQQPEVTDEALNEPSPPAGELPSIVIGGIEILDAKVAYLDEQQGQRIRIEPMNLTTGEVQLGVPIPVNLDMTVVQGQGAQAQTIDLDLAVKAMADLKSQLYTLSDLDIKVSVAGESIPGNKMDLTLAANVIADLANEQATIDALNINVLGIDINGKATAKSWSQQLAYTADISTSTINLLNVMDAFDVPAPKTAKAGALTRLEIQAAFSGTDKRVAMDKLAVRLDESRLDGKMSVSNFAKPAIDVSMTVDKINLDHYLPPEADKPAKGKQAPEGPPADEEKPLDLPVKMMRDLDVDAVFEIKDMIIKNLTVKDASVTLAAHKGLLQLAPAKFALYEGGYNGQVDLDVRGQVPVLSVKQTLNNVKSGPLLLDFMGDKIVSGTLVHDLDVNTRGLSIADFKRNLNGTLSMKFADGSFDGSSLEAKLREAIRYFDKKAASKPLQFAQLNLTGTINSGVITNKDLYLGSPLFQAKGSGTYSLPESKVKYRVLISEPPRKGANPDFLPIDIKGPISDLDISVRVDELVKQAADKAADEARAEVQKQVDAEKKKIEENLKKEQKKLEKELKKELENNLKNLFK